MSSFRTKKDRNFTCIDNFILTDNRLSYKAKGIWLYAMSRPEDWVFYISDIANHSNEKEKSIRSGLKELEEYGYLRKTQKKDDKGKFAPSDWEFYEKPQDFQKIYPQPPKRHAVFGHAGFGHAEKGALLNTEEQNTDLTKEMLCSFPSVGEKEEKIHIEFAYKDYLGAKKTIRKEDLIFSATKCKKDWSILEIEEAWKIMITYVNISNPFQLMDGIIKKLRIKEFNLQKTKEMEKSCNKKEQEANNNPYLKNMHDWTSKDYLKTQSELAKKAKLEKDMKEQAFLKCKDSNQSSQKF